MRRPENNPYFPSDLDPPEIPIPPTRYEDLSSKPAAQIAYKHSYYSGYGIQRAVQRIYENNEQEYRNLYYRMHLEVDNPLDMVRKAVTDDTSREKIIFRTSDHVTQWVRMAVFIRSGSIFTTSRQEFHLK